MLRIIRPVNELFARADDYFRYKRVSTEGGYQDFSTHGLRFQNKTDLQIRPHVFLRSDPAGFFSFWTISKSPAALVKLITFAVCCFQLYLEGRGLGSAYLTHGECDGGGLHTM